jgi:signal transduction histidine kinase
MPKLLKKPPSLTLRLILVAILWSIAALMAGGFGLATIFGNYVDKSFENSITVYLDTLAATADVDKNSKLVVERPPTDPRFTRPLSGYYWMVADIDGNGKIIANQVRSRSLFDETINLPDGVVEKAASKPGVDSYYNINRSGENLKIGARQITLPDRKINTILVVAFDRTELEKSKSRFNLILMSSLLALVVGLMMAIILQVKLGLKPLRQMGSQLGDIRSGKAENLDENLPIEIAPIARELNALLQHNEEVVERARTHVGNLAHALKTPISVMLNEAGQHEDAFSQLVSRQTQTMQRQVEHYLKRARAAARAETLRTRTPIGPVVDDITRTLTKLYRSEGVLVEVLNTTSAAFRGEREDLEDLFGNLAENACKYGGGLVEISFDETQEGYIRILIDDDGEGLTESEVKAALKRGVRLDESSNGSGLGLSIAHELAVAYGGALDFEKSPLGGLRANLRLPIADTVN